jgi:hypothetical protein
MSKLSIECERISANDKPKENPFKTGKINSSDWEHLYPEGRNQNAIQRSDYHTDRNPLD